MRTIALLFALSLLSGRAVAAAPAEASTLPLPPPPWYTDEVHRKVLAADGRGVEVPWTHEQAPLVLFALGRTAGWIAHAIEQYAAATLIRPRARYTGPLPDL